MGAVTFAFLGLFSTISVQFQYQLGSCAAISINQFQKFAWQLNQGQLNISPPPPPSTHPRLVAFRLRRVDSWVDRWFHRRAHQGGLRAHGANSSQARLLQRWCVPTTFKLPPGVLSALNTSESENSRPWLKLVLCMPGWPFYNRHLPQWLSWREFPPLDQSPGGQRRRVHSVPEFVGGYFYGFSSCSRGRSQQKSGGRFEEEHMAAEVDVYCPD